MLVQCHINPHCCLYVRLGIQRELHRTQERLQASISSERRKSTVGGCCTSKCGCSCGWWAQTISLAFHLPLRPPAFAALA